MGFNSTFKGLNIIHAIHLCLQSLANHSKTIALHSDGGAEVKPGVHNFSKKKICPARSKF
jgi:hypothetical protein